jgi:hypothetical protein
MFKGGQMNAADEGPLEEADLHGYLRKEDGQGDGGVEPNEVRERIQGDARPSWRKEWKRPLERSSRPARPMKPFERRKKYTSPTVDKSGELRDM